MNEYIKFFTLQILGKGAKFFFELAPLYILGAVVYGEFSYLIAIATLAVGLSVLGLPVSLLRLIPEWEKNTPDRNIAFSIWDIQLLVFLVIAPGIFVFLGERFENSELAIFILFVFLNSIVNSYSTILRTKGRIKTWYFYQEVLLPVLILVGIFTVYVTISQPELGHMLWVMFSASALSVCIVVYKIYIFYGPLICIRWPFNGDTCSVVKVSFPLFCTSFSYLLLSRIDVVMLGNYIPYELLGGYNVVARITFQTLILWQIFASYLMPIIAKQFIEEEYEGIVMSHRKYIKYSIAGTVVVSLILVVGINTIDMKYFINTWNKDLLDSVYILLLAQFVSVAFSSFGYILLYIKKERYSYFNSGLMLVSAIAANLLLIPDFGVIGASVATLITVTVVKAAEVLQVYSIRGTLYLRIHEAQYRA